MTRGFLENGDRGRPNPKDTRAYTAWMMGYFSWITRQGMIEAPTGLDPDLFALGEVAAKNDCRIPTRRRDYGDLRGWAAISDSIYREYTLGDDRPYPVNDPVRQVALILEEAGEAIKEALDITRVTRDGGIPRSAYARLADEVRQTAAMCYRFLTHHQYPTHQEE